MKKLFFIFMLLLLSKAAVFGQKQYDDNLYLLKDERINPKFSELVRKFMDSAKAAGFKPVIKEAFRSFEKAQETAQRNKKLGIPAAAVSVHSFGLAVDIWLANDKNEVFSFDPADYKKNKENRFSYSQWLKFIKIGESFGLINAYMHNDTDHWEFHPNWSKTDWINAKKIILPIYNQYPNLSELEKLKIIWNKAGL